jgi:hypothetical protein
MKGFSEMRDFVTAQSAKFRMAEEGWHYDTIELNTFREILCFAISEGFQADAKAIDRVLNGEDENSEDEEDDNTDWHFMGIVMEAMEEQIRKHVLPEKTTVLYKLWLSESRDIDADYWD